MMEAIAMCKGTRVLLLVLFIALLMLPIAALAQAPRQDHTLFLPLVIKEHSTDPITLQSWVLSPFRPRVGAGQSFGVYYHIRNNTEMTRTVYLLAEARSPQGTDTYLPPTTASDEIAVAVEAAPGLAWYERNAAVPADAAGGWYDLTWAVSSVDGPAGILAQRTEQDALYVISPYPAP
jgi:hypothetical protein